MRITSQLWSYRFFVLREDIQVLRGTRQESTQKWWKETKGASELDVRRGIAKLFASSVKVLDDTQESSIFREQLTLVRELKSAIEFRKSKPHNLR